jgi:hypothetical protein
VARVLAEMALRQLKRIVNSRFKGIVA